MATFNPTYTEEELKAEEWRDVVGYETYYEVSSLGRVRRKPDARDKWGRLPVRGKADGIRAQKITKTGAYLTIDLSASGTTMRYYMQRIVAAAFIGPRPDGCEVDHLDFDRMNNRASNLHYVTHRENIDRSMAAGRCIRGERCGASKLTESEVREIRRRFAAGEKAYDLAREYGAHPQSIYNVINRFTWKHVA